ncbi:MAG: aminotransferase DegT [Dorea sp.]|nr:aminotransferase DegT [Dorea sp.]
MDNFITKERKADYDGNERFADIKPFERKLWLSSPTMHGDEQRYADEAIQKNWVSTVGENIDEIEKLTAQKLGRKYAVALSSGTAALHLAVRLAAERLYGPTAVNRGVLEGRKVFCSDMTFAATVNPVSYEGGECVFIDTGYDDWNMDPKALETAFQSYPEVRLIILVHLYGTPCVHMEELREIADRHHALIIEDAAESLGASIFLPTASLMTPKEARDGIWRQTGSFGDYSIISFNGNKIITGSSGGMLLSDDEQEAHKCRKWSTQSREDALWYQHEELGYNYRMSNVIAGIVRGQLPYLGEHIRAKERIWKRYKDGLKDLPISMNPVDLKKVRPNYWLSCMTIDKEHMCPQIRGEKECLWKKEAGHSCPEEILDALRVFHAEGRPIWKPMHLQPVYRNYPFITVDGVGRGRSNAYIREDRAADAGGDIFSRGLCLPSDNKMSEEEQDRIIEIIHRCFR